MYCSLIQNRSRVKSRRFGEVLQGKNLFILRTDFLEGAYFKILLVLRKETELYFCSRKALSKGREI